jgi:hypothetical protein
MHVRSILKRPFQLPRPPRAGKKNPAGAWPRVSLSPPGPRGRGRTRSRQEGSSRVKREAVAVGPGENGRVPRQPVHRVTTTRSAWGVVQTPRWQKRSDTVPILRDETTTRLQWQSPAPRAAGVGDTVSRPPPVAKSLTSPHLTSPTPGPQPAPSPQAETVDVSTRPLVVVEAVAPHPPRPRPPRLRLPLSPPPPTAYKYLPRTRHGLTLRSAAPLHFLLLPPAPAPVSPVSTHVSAEAEELPCRSEKSARPSRLPPGDSFGRPNPQGVAAGGGRRAGVRPRSAAHEQRTRERGNKEVSPPPACCAPVPILGIAFSLCSACFLNSWYCSCAAALLRIIDR